ncbi:hypothetical protein Q9233_000023 [Columba guinea]|nr:hypothetical protein Q9233_000023 [Columba guinea]
MKCFLRYLPYLFRPPSAILSASCHAEEWGVQCLMPENCTECPEDALMDGWMMLMLMIKATETCWLLLVLRQHPHLVGAWRALCRHDLSCSMGSVHRNAPCAAPGTIRAQSV